MVVTKSLLSVYIHVYNYAACSYVILEAKNRNWALLVMQSHTNAAILSEFPWVTSHLLTIMLCINGF